jgi:tripartite-type tricarboxylate transporter receptor subunit TctC
MRLLLLALAFAMVPAWAQAWPAKPVRFIVPFPPGGSTDVAARTVAEKLSRALGQQVVVDNRGGGGGAIGTVESARAAADGYTLLFVADPVITLHLVVKNVQFDMQRDFAAITQVTTQPIAVAVHSSVPVKSVQELVAYAKANPGKLSFAHSYKGGGPAVQDLVAGQVPMGVLGSTPLIPHHKSGRIRIIAFTSKERFPPMPEIPTLHESGLAGFDTTQWLGILAPKGTPAEIISRVHVETAKALALPEVKERLAQAALQAVGSTPKEFEALIRADLERWSAIARELKLEPQ